MGYNTIPLWKKSSKQSLSLKYKIINLIRRQFKDYLDLSRIKFYLPSIVKGLQLFWASYMFIQSSFHLLFYSITIKYFHIIPLFLLLKTSGKHTHIYKKNLWEIQVTLKFYQGNLVLWKNLFFTRLSNVAKVAKGIKTVALSCLKKHSYWVFVNPRNLRNSSFLWNFVPWVFSLHSSLLTDPKSPGKEIVLALGSREWKAVCLEHFGTVNYHSTKRSLNVRCWRVLTDWQRRNMNNQLPITKEWVKTIFWLTQKGKAWHKLFDNNTCIPYSFSCYSLFKNIVRSLFLQYYSFNKYLLNIFYVQGTLLC